MSGREVEETDEYRAERAKDIARYAYLDPPYVAVALLFTGKPTDRALEGWYPNLWTNQSSRNY